MINKNFIISLLYNCIELYIIIIIGLKFNFNINDIIAMCLVFFISRFIFKLPLHYKSLYQCAIFSMAVFVSLFLVLEASLSICLLTTVFVAYVVSGKSNINDMFMWSKKSKYQPLIDFLKIDYNNIDVVEYENDLRSRDKIMAKLFKLKFRDNLPLEKIQEQINIYDNKTIIMKLDTMYEVMRYNLGLKETNEED